MFSKRKTILFEVNVNISPTKKRKESETNVGCILQCTEKYAELRITKFSETTKKTVYEAAKKRNDEKVIAIIESFGECLPPPEFGYHRKCYQKYAHGKLKKVHKSKRVQKRESSKKRSRRYDLIICFAN